MKTVTDDLIKSWQVVVDRLHDAKPNTDQYGYRSAIEKCIDELQAMQSHPSPMSAEQVCRWVKASERLPEIGIVVLVKYFDTYQELYYKNNVWFVKGTNLVAYSECFSLQLEWLETLSTTPSVKADGWVSVDKEKEFHKVLKCLKNNKVMVGTREDGIYIRLAGRESEGEAFTLHFALAYPFPKLPPHQNKNK